MLCCMVNTALHHDVRWNGSTLSTWLTLSTSRSRKRTRSLSFSLLYLPLYSQLFFFMSFFLSLCLFFLAMHSHALWHMPNSPWSFFRRLVDDRAFGMTDACVTLQPLPERHMSFCYSILSAAFSTYVRHYLAESSIHKTSHD